MIFKRGNGEENSASVFAVDCISESRSWSRPGMQGVEFSAPLYIFEKDENNGVVFERSVTRDVLAVDSSPEHAILGTAGYAGQFAPLYVKHIGHRRANFDEECLETLFSDVEQPHQNSPKVWPEDIFDYVYASLHSPTYREKYKEFLKTDFPRVPRPKSWAEFWRLVPLGRELRELHLMKSPALDNYATTFPQPGDNIVEKVKYEDGKVWINEQQYFGNVPELAWNFYIGGYQPAQKWLKDRKGRDLSSTDLDHYQKIIKTLLETNRIMKEINDV